MGGIPLEGGVVGGWGFFKKWVGGWVLACQKVTTSLPRGHQVNPWLCSIPPPPLATARQTISSRPLTNSSMIFSLVFVLCLFNHLLPPWCSAAGVVQQWGSITVPPGLASQFPPPMCLRFHAGPPLHRLHTSAFIFGKNWGGNEKMKKNEKK